MPRREVVIGVTGGIAAYKTAMVVSQLAQADIGVTVVMTPAAQTFVGPATFEALTGRPVYSQVFGNADLPLGAHIELARRAELLCVAPATANFLAKAAQGEADDLLTTMVLCCTCPVFVAPAMNCEMWEKPAVQRNIATLRADGVNIIDPEEGWLSCRQRGIGRMAAPERILAAIRAALDQPAPDQTS